MVSDGQQVNGVIVYRDSAGYFQERPVDPSVEQLKAELAAGERSFTEYGGGYVDFSDTDTANGNTTVLPAGVPTQLIRSLASTTANTRLNRPFNGHQFWDDSAKLIRGRALYDIVATSMFVRVIPDKLGGVLRIAIQAGAIEVGGKNMALTAPVGSEESIRADFIFPVRNMLLTNGGKIMLTATVPMTLIEFSPEFYPLGYEA